MDFENRKDVIFSITEKPVFVEGEVVEGKKALCRADNGSVLGIVGSRYTPMDNYQVMKHIDSILSDGSIDYRINKGFSARGGASTAIELSFPDKRIVVDGKDCHELRCYVSNAFDGSSSVKLDMGFFRFVCSNGAMVGNRDMSISIGHFRDVDKKTVNQIMLYIGKKFNEAKNFIIGLTQMAFQNRGDVEEIIMATDILAERYRQKVLDEWKKNGSSLFGWMLYNAYTYILTHVVRANIFTKMAMMKALSRESFEWMNQKTELQLAG